MAAKTISRSSSFRSYNCQVNLTVTVSGDYSVKVNESLGKRFGIWRVGLYYACYFWKEQELPTLSDRTLKRVKNVSVFVQNALKFNAVGTSNYYLKFEQNTQK